MSTLLVTNWTEHDKAFSQILAMLGRELRIFDRDLTKLALERPERNAMLRDFVLRSPKNRLRIIVRSPSWTLSGSPRLERLLRDCSHNFELMRAPEDIANLTDSLVIVDNRHALVRFHDDHARSKLIADSIEETAGYLRRFDEAWNSSTSPVSAKPLGL